MAFQFLDAQHQKAIDFGSEIGSLSSSANAYALSQSTSAKSYAQQAAAMETGVNEFNQNAQMQVAAQKTALKGQGEFSVEAAAMGLPAIGSVISKGYQIATAAKALPGILRQGVQGVQTAVKALPQAASDAANTLKGAATDLIQQGRDAVNGLANQATDIISGGVNDIVQSATTVGKSAQAAVSGLSDAAQQTAGEISTATSKAATSAVSQATAAGEQAVTQATAAGEQAVANVGGKAAAYTSNIAGQGEAALQKGTSGLSDMTMPGGGMTPTTNFQGLYESGAERVPVFSGLPAPGSSMEMANILPNVSEAAADVSQVAGENVGAVTSAATELGSEGAAAATNLATEGASALEGASGTASDVVSSLANLAPTAEEATGALSDVGAALASGAGEAALAIPGVGEVLGAGAAVYGLYEGIKDLFSSQPSAPAEVENQVQATPSFTSSGGQADLQQSFQSGV